MKGCGKVLAAICLILFVLSAMLSLLFVNVRFYLLSAETYSRILREAGVFEKLPAIVADQLRYGMTYNICIEAPEVCEGEGLPEDLEQVQKGPPSYFANLPEDVWEDVLRNLIDPIWVEAQTESVLDQVFSLLVKEPARDAIVISMIEIKDRIGSEAGYQAVAQVIRAQPDCTPSQLLELTDTIEREGLKDIVIQCRPPEDLMDQAKPYIRSGLAEVVVDLPSSIEIDIPGEISTGNGGVTIARSILRAAFRYAPWITFFWLMAVTVFAVRDLRSWLGWWGTGLFLAGLGTFILGFSLGPFLGWWMNWFVSSQAPGGITPVAMDIFLDVFDRVMGGFSIRVLAQSGIILGVGLIMLVVRLFTRRKSYGQIGVQLTEPR